MNTKPSRSTAAPARTRARTVCGAAPTSAGRGRCERRRVERGEEPAGKRVVERFPVAAPDRVAVDRTSAGSSVRHARRRVASTPHSAATVTTGTAPSWARSARAGPHGRGRARRDEPSPRDDRVAVGGAARRPRAAPSPRACTTAARRGPARRAAGAGVRARRPPAWSGATSSTSTPPIVACAPDERSTMRSPGASGSGEASRSRREARRRRRVARSRAGCSPLTRRARRASRRRE